MPPTGVPFSTLGPHRAANPPSTNRPENWTTIPNVNAPIQDDAGGVNVPWVHFFAFLAARAAWVGNLGTSVPLAITSPVGLTSSVVANVGSIQLGPGIWDVDGTVIFNPTGTPTALAAGISLVSAAFPPANADDTSSQRLNMTFPAATVQTLGTGRAYINITTAGLTTVYLVAEATFTGTCAVTGKMLASRVG